MTYATDTESPLESTAAALSIRAASESQRPPAPRSGPEMIDYSDFMARFAFVSSEGTPFALDRI
ncbi:MAG: hypothetical protein ACR2RL_20730, partial [Gammaproteobacteria bacterium]